MGDWIDDTLELNKHIFNTFFWYNAEKNVLLKSSEYEIFQTHRGKKGACHS